MTFLNLNLGAKEERNVLDELLGIPEDDLENDLDIGNDLIIAKKRSTVSPAGNDIEVNENDFFNLIFA